MKISAWGMLGFALLSAVVSASPIDNPSPGQALVQFDKGPSSKFITFASTEALPNNNPVRNFLKINYVTAGTTTLVNNGIDFNTTLQSVGPLGAPVEAKLIVNRITGTLDASTGVQVVNWTLRATMSFRAIDSTSTTVIDDGFCETTNFNIVIHGAIGSGAVSSSFTIPALDPLGDGDCNGWWDKLNTDFSLGTAGAKFEMNKYWAEVTPGGALIVGS